jgi:hypothetical protein
LSVPHVSNAHRVQAKITVSDDHLVVAQWATYQLRSLLASATLRRKLEQGFQVTITLDIRPEVQAELARQAAAHGVDIVAYVASVLEEAAQVPVGSKTFSRSQLGKTLNELAQFSHKVPVLPDDAISRESLYRDHD